MSEVKANPCIQIGEIKMPSVRTISTSIKVPEDKYTALKEIKDIEETSISALVLEGIDLLIKQRASVLRDSTKEKGDIILKVLRDLEE